MDSYGIDEGGNIYFRIEGERLLEAIKKTILELYPNLEKELDMDETFLIEKDETPRWNDLTFVGNEVIVYLSTGKEDLISAYIEKISKQE